MEKLFTLHDAWSGGHFELALDLGEQSDQSLRRVLVALWKRPTLEGCYLQRKIEPAQQERFDPANPEVLLEDALHGIAHLPNGRRAACASFVIQFEEGPNWLVLALPMGTLGYIYPVGAYPFNDGSSLEWRDEVNEWLREIGETIFGTITFRFGVIGYEVMGEPCVEEVASTRNVPQERWEGYLIPEGEALKWYPPTEGAPADVG
jgi:hypothetical protein